MVSIDRENNRSVTDLNMIDGGGYDDTELSDDERRQ